MTTALLDRVRRFADAHVTSNGITQTPIRGLAVIRETDPTPIHYQIFRPSMAIVLQGWKRVTIGDDTSEHGPGSSQVVSIERPVLCQVTQATPDAPHLALMMDLNLPLIAELVRDMGAPSAGLGYELTDMETVDSAHRLFRLLDRPAALPVLKDQLVRELHYWLLAGRHGDDIRALGVADSYVQRVGRAVALMRTDFSRQLRVDELATAAGLSSSAFHAHFRAITSLTPLQFLKHLRLIEARRLMIDEGLTVTGAAFGVGYESVPQFTREYARMFGTPPARDVRASRARPVEGDILIAAAE